MSLRNKSVFSDTSAIDSRLESAIVEAPTQSTNNEMPFPLIEASLLITFFATMALVVNLYLLNVCLFPTKTLFIFSYF